PMAEHVDAWTAKGVKNIFDNTVKVVEMQSEGGASGTVHGSLAAGALTTTYTASQGLLLMIPNMYKIAGELLPSVFHVSARTVSVHGLSIFGDHSDVMACRQTGFALLASANPQEVMDMGAVAHLSAIKGRVPFLHFFDGFRTSHEIQKIEALDYEDMAKLVDQEAINQFRKASLNPEHPYTIGTTQNPDIFFQGREACNNFYTDLPDVVENYMNAINQLTGRNYKLFDYYGDENATDIIIAMGSGCDTIKETVDYLNANGSKTGLIAVHLYRPFSLKHFFQAMPASVERIAVLDRTKEPGGLAEPLYQDVCQAYFEKSEKPVIIGGRYGLSSKDTTPAMIISVYENLAKENPKKNFTIGIHDDVTFLSLEQKEPINVTPKDCVSCKIWGIGSDGTVGANKNSIKIIGEQTDLYTQAYFVYDSKKSGGLTQSHLRFGKEPIRSTYLVNKADYVACHNPSYLDKYDLLKDLKEGAIFLLNCRWNKEELKEHLPLEMKRYMAEHNINFYTIDAISIAKELGLGARINTILQAAFFKLIHIIPIEDAVKYMKDAIHKTYAKKGQKIVDMNHMAVDRGLTDLIKIDVDESWKHIEIPVEKKEDNRPDFIKNVVVPMNRQEGDRLPVSTFLGIENGRFPNGTTAYEKRGAAVDVPKWYMEKCIQCNLCAYVCPHATIRPFLLSKEEAAKAPFATKKAKGKDLDQYQYRIQISPLDCTGCGSCEQICPTKALEMKALATQMPEKDNWEFAMTIIEKEDLNLNTIKGSQFATPLFEFSGACAGCGETPYIKLATQLFGDRMYIANASGCSSAYGGSTPSTPYTTNKKGHGPAWAMSLFEDNAEYAYGMMLGSEQMRDKLAQELYKMSGMGIAKKEVETWIKNINHAKDTRKISYGLIEALQKYPCKNDKEKEMVDLIIENKEYLSKKSYWAFGGDGWAYDIGYGGLDHVIASGDDINMLVFDTEVYSNTGGQSSKATALGAIAKFASAGKRIKKKDLGLMAMSYGYVYVAQVAMGADYNQVLKAMIEAENYPGPSLIIAYSPCIEHGIKGGMACSQAEMKKAVECGYWHLYRYNPQLKDEGKNPFILDSKEPTKDIEEFLRGEIRYASLALAYPQEAKEMFAQAEKDAKEKYEQYKKLAEQA
ncbi:MAG: pyruvate:ferredoxin (flavodoxin) oxidoreductase, partial [Clostridia bacterium]|nr:pyruvate:ferredoxin (flavodoxin) oxidoreductase [Clostridia bacterium]